MTDETAYRYVDEAVSSGVDEHDRPLGSARLYVCCVVRRVDYRVLRRTPKGFWVDAHGEPRFVRLKSNKRFAVLDPEEALVDYRVRKSRQASIYEARLDEARRRCDAAGRVLNRIHNHGDVPPKLIGVAEEERDVLQIL